MFEGLRRHCKGGFAWYVKSSPWLAAFFALFGAGFIAARLDSNAEQFLTSTTTIGWTAAAATLFAAIVALWVASRASRDVEERERRAGQLVVASSRTVLPLVTGHLNLATKSMQDPNIPDDAKVGAVCERFQACEALLMPIDHARIYAYSPELAAEIVNLMDILRLLIYGATRTEQASKTLAITFGEACPGLTARSLRAQTLAAQARAEAIDPWLQRLDIAGQIANAEQAATAVAPTEHERNRP